MDWAGKIADRGRDINFLPGSIRKPRTAEGKETWVLHGRGTFLTQNCCRYNWGYRHEEVFKLDKLAIGGGGHMAS